MITIMVFYITEYFHTAKIFSTLDFVVTPNMELPEVKCYKLYQLVYISSNIIEVNEG